MVCDPVGENNYGKKGVLILILLEYGLRRESLLTRRACPSCLNPYSIGIWSATSSHWHKGQECAVLILILLEYGLRRKLFFSYGAKTGVLILILLEYGLRLKKNEQTDKESNVLILILLEYGLRQINKILTITRTCLNPYSIGIWSATQRRGTQKPWPLLS